MGLLAFCWSFLLTWTAATAVPRLAADRPAGLPESIDPFEFARLVGERGVIDADEWLLCEDAFLARQARLVEVVDPAIERLLDAANAQSWMNWPGLKPAVPRHQRAAIANDILEADWQLFDELAERIPALAAPLGHAKRAWTRRAVGLGGQFHLLGPVDLPAALERMRWTPEERRAIEPELDRWAEADFERRRAARAAGAAALDDFERRLDAMGIDASRDAETRATWLPRAFEAWLASSNGVRAVMLEAIAAHRATIDRLADLLSPARAEELRILGVEALMAPEIASIADGRPDRLDGFGASEELLDGAFDAPGASDPDRAWIAATRSEWRGRSLRILRAMEREAGKATTPIWPLLGGGWEGEEELRSSIDRSIATLLDELGRERDANDVRVREALSARFGAPFGERLDATIEERRLRRRKAAEGNAAARRPERWDPSPYAPPFVPGRQGEALAYDPGPIDASEAEAMIAFVGAGEATRASWKLATDRLRDEALARIAALGVDGQLPSPWEFSSSGYHFNASLAARIEAAAVEQREFLAQREEAIVDALAAAMPTSSEASTATAKIRIEVVRRRRSIDRDLASLASDPRSGPDQRDRSNPCRAVWPALETDGALEQLAPLLTEVADIMAKRAETAATTLPRIHALDVRLQWERGADREGLERERTLLRARFREADAPFRAAAIAAIERLVDAACDRTPAQAPTIRGRWLATGLATLFASVPPAHAALRRATESDDEALRHRAEAITARYEAHDRPLIERMVREAIANGDGDQLRPEAAAHVWNRQRRISEGRDLVSDLAIVALRLTPPTSH